MAWALSIQLSIDPDIIRHYLSCQGSIIGRRIMINALRSLRFSFVPCGLALGFFLAGCHNPTIELTPTPAEPPGITMGPFMIGSGLASASGTITVESVNSFSGPVTLSASCCQDMIRDLWAPLDGTGNFLWSFANPLLNIPAKGSASSVLNLSMPAVGTAPLLLVPKVPFGKYLIPVVGKDQSGKISETVNVGVRVLPTFEAAPTCKPGVEVFRMGPVILPAQIAAAEASPRKKSITMAIYRATGPNVGQEAIALTITDDSGLSPAFSRWVLVHKGKKNDDKEISTIGCSSLGKSISAKQGQTSVQMTLVQTQDRTLYIRNKNICTNFLCTSTVWGDWAVFADAAFWSVFGGKSVKVEWHDCTPVLLWCI